MKASHFKVHGKSRQASQLSLAFAMSIGIAASAWPTQAQAVAVDSELVLLVDIVQPELSQSNFNGLMNAYASTFTSSQMLNSIQAGATGRIAVSMMFYGGAGTQVTAVPWMSIGNATDATTFASLVMSAIRPTTFAFSNSAAALNAATQSFGTETGAAGNGFESTVQIIEVASAGIPLNSQAAAATAASANALASGVDLINAVAMGTFSNAITNFYANNVIGSTLPGVTPSLTTSPLNGALALTLQGNLSTAVGTGASASISAVPEPGTLALLVPAMVLLFGRRRR